MEQSAVKAYILSNVFTIVILYYMTVPVTRVVVTRETAIPLLLSQLEAPDPGHCWCHLIIIIMFRFISLHTELDTLPGVVEDREG